MRRGRAQFTEMEDMSYVSAGSWDSLPHADANSLSLARCRVESWPKLCRVETQFAAYLAAAQTSPANITRTLSALATGRACLQVWR